MIKRFLKISAIAFSFSVFGYAIVVACGWGWDWDGDLVHAVSIDRREFITPKDMPLAHTWRFFYPKDFVGHYVGDRTADEQPSINEQVFQDWRGYLGKNFSDEVIHTCMFGDDYLTELEKIKAVANDNKGRNFVHFITLSREAERAYKTYDAGWDDANEPLNTIDDAQLFKAVQELLDNASDNFIRQRAWFLLLRMYFYSDNEREKCTQVFDKYEKEMPKDLLYYRALGYTAGILYAERNFEQSNAIYARIYNNCPQLIRMATYSYHPLEEDGMSHSLTYAISDDNKCGMWALQGYYTDEKIAIREIAKINAKHPSLNTMLSRLMDKGFSSMNYIDSDLNFAQNKKNIYASISYKLLETLEYICQNYPEVDQYKWRLALSFWQSAHGKYDEAAQNYNIAESYKSNKTPNPEGALRIARLMNMVNKVQTSNDLNNQELIADIRWADGGDLAKWVYNYIANLYNSEENEVMQQMFACYNYDDANMNDYYSTQENIDAIIEFINKPNKTELEKLAASIYKPTMDILLERKAALYILEGDMKLAVSTYEKVSDKQYFQVNPFNGYIQDDHDRDFAKGKSYSKAKAYAIMQEMKEKLDNNNGEYTDALLLGNALYNLSGYGSARVLNGTNDIYNFPMELRKIAVNMSLAKDYYSQAFALATNDEQRAKALYMKAKCERNEYYNKTFYTYSNQWAIPWETRKSIPDFREWESFKILNSDYSHTQFEIEVIKECGYYKYIYY